MRGQLSAEMLILMVLIVALAVVAYTYMNNAVNTVGNAVVDRAGSAAAEGNPYYCTSNSDCEKFSNLKTCDTTTNTCK